MRCWFLGTSLQRTSKVTNIQDAKTYIYSLPDFQLVQTLDYIGGASGGSGGIVSIAYSPSGKHLAIASRSMYVYTCADWTVQVEGVYHTAKINSVRWSPDSNMVVTASNDTNLVVWGLNGNKVVVKNAHLEAVNKACFTKDGRVVSVGQDAFIRVSILDVQNPG